MTVWFLLPIIMSVKVIIVESYVNENLLIVMSRKHATIVDNEYDNLLLIVTTVITCCYC